MLDRDRLDLVLVEIDPATELMPRWPHDLVGVREPKGTKSRPG